MLVLTNLCYIIVSSMKIQCGAEYLQSPWLFLMRLNLPHIRIQFLTCPTRDILLRGLRDIHRKCPQSKHRLVLHPRFQMGQTSSESSSNQHSSYHPHCHCFLIPVNNIPFTSLRFKLNYRHNSPI